MPSQSGITFRPTLRDVMGRFTRADKALLENKRKAVRTLGRRWVEIAQEEAPQGKTGAFKASIRFRTFAKQNEVGFTTSSLQPLGTFIVQGTRPHRIAARGGALYFFWGKVGMFTVVPKSGGFDTHVSNNKLWIGKGYVDHPGTRANPYIERAYVRWAQDMEKEIEAVADRFVIDVVGGK